MKQNRAEETIRRIREMEPLLDECAEATRDLATQLDRMEALHDKMAALFGYYGSADWHEDREARARGELPADLKCGVLSEDLVYDVITDVRDAAFQMLELATDVLKNRI